MVTGRLPDERLEELPIRQRAIVARALSSDPSTRYANGHALWEALEAAGATARSGPIDSHDELPPEEQSWIRAVALTLAGATALSLYAFLVSMTPRILPADDILPFVVFGAEPRGQNLLFTRARFETFPTLAAAGGWAVALSAYGLLRRHWRHAGFDRKTPDRPVRGTRTVVVFAIVLNTLFLARMLLERAGARSVGNYIPVIGGVLELCMLYVVWVAVLEANRTSRPLRKEILLWCAVALSLFPPVLSFVRMLLGRDL
jgi:serine/threonine-protein kinase